MEFLCYCNKPEPKPIENKAETHFQKYLLSHQGFFFSPSNRNIGKMMSRFAPALLALIQCKQFFKKKFGKNTFKQGKISMAFSKKKVIKINLRSQLKSYLENY